MAIKQTVTFTKAGGSFANIGEAVDSINSIAVDPDPSQDIHIRRANGEFTATASFDVASQTLTIARVWVELHYNDYKASQTWVSTTATLEQAGWSMTETLETV